jgi:hypothetical protein
MALIVNAIAAAKIKRCDMIGVNRGGKGAFCTPPPPEKLLNSNLSKFTV